MDEHAKAWLAEKGYDPVYGTLSNFELIDYAYIINCYFYSCVGARPLNRLIQKKILNPLAMCLIEVNFYFI